MKKLFVTLMVLVGLISFTGCKSFKVNVNLENSNGKTVYLNRYENETMKTLDSVVVADNMAVFKVRASKNLDALHIMMDGWRRPLAFFADNQDVNITGDCQKYNTIKVEGSESQSKLNEFMHKSDLIEDEQELYYHVADFVKSNIDNPLGVYALNRYKWAFNISDLEAIYESIPENVQSGYKNQVKKYIDGLKMTSPGKKFIDFELPTLNGNLFKFSNIVNESKIIILDFWASWCPDCRKANPDLVALYEEFKDKGLDIVSVSLDTDASAWAKAIIDDSLSWKHHVSDLKGWDNAAAALYTISYIPQTFVIDGSGIIMEKNLPFEKMEDLISNVLK